MQQQRKCAEIRSKKLFEKVEQTAPKRSTVLEWGQEVRVRKLPDFDGPVGAAGEEPVVLVHVDLENALKDEQQCHNRSVIEARNDILYTLAVVVAKW